MRRRGLRGNEDGLWWAVLAASRDLFLCLGVVLVGCDRAGAPAPTVGGAPGEGEVGEPRGGRGEAGRQLREAVGGTRPAPSGGSA